jgi:TorA maturation chaperone TorD
MSHPPRVPASPLSASQMALARSRLYSLLGRIHLKGVEEEDLDRVHAIPDLATVIPDPFQPDEAAADHQHLFGFNVFPFESIFLDVSGLLGGDVTDGVVASYQAAGFGGWETSEGADHIGHELSFVGSLCGAEHDAWEDGLPAVARRMAGLQAEFLDRHLLRWLPPLALAIRAHDHPFYTAMVDLTLELATDHWGGAAGNSKVIFELPALPDLLEDEKTGLKEIAAYLLVPAYSGLYLSRDHIGRLARRHRLPRGFGGRQNMLLNLLRSAASYEGTGAILAALQVLADGWAGKYEEMPAGKPWGKRARRTAELLAEMIARAAGLAE